MFRKILLLAAAAALPAAFAADTDMDRATLRGVKSFKVVIDPLRPELKKEGFTVNELAAQIQKKLQGAGITPDSEAKEFLGLTVKALRAGGRRAPWVMTFELGFYQVVGLTRNQTIKTVTETWAVEDAMLVQPKLLNQITRTAVDNLVDQFLSAYQAVNPK